jgi:DNA-binding GntR family transcriptional regulator
VTITRVYLAEEIGNRLRDQILTGKLEPGQRLTEQAVAREMGTSPGPVREAFSALCREGLLISLPHRGTFVSEVSEHEARTAYDVRALLEPYVMERATERLTPEVVEELSDLIAQMRKASENKDFPATMVADLAFHGRIYELGGGPLLAKIWSTIRITILKFAVVAAPQYYRDTGPTVADHDYLLHLLETKDVEVLRAETSRHLNDLWNRIYSA